MNNVISRVGRRREDADRQKWQALRSIILEPTIDDRDAEMKRWVRRKHSIVGEEMFAIVKAAKEAKSFKEDAAFYRKIERSVAERESHEQEEKKDTAPVFNKRLFASQGAVIITGEARRIMARNASANARCDMNAHLTKTEVQCMRCVVDGLKLIHKGQDFVKDVLSKVVSYEVYKPFDYVPTKHWEDHLACYYILNGAVEVTYDLRSRESRHVFQANIIYSHGTGEYLGLVSPEGPREDLSPPATIYMKEMTQFIRIDRERFHKLMSDATQMIDQRKRNFIKNHSFLTSVSDEVKDKILHKLAIQDYPANRVLLAQGETTEYIYIVMKGRCHVYREVHIPETGSDKLFYLTSREEDDFFGEECVLDQDPSVSTLVTATATTCLKLHRSALKMVNREKLTRHIESHRHEIPSDQCLRDRGYNDSIWNKFKHSQVKATLKEAGNLRYLSRPRSAPVRERPPPENEMLQENMRRFVMDGGQYEPLRVHSAVYPTNRSRPQSRRPKTAMAGLITETLDQEETSSADDKENAEGDEVDAVAGSNSSPDQLEHVSEPSKVMSVQKAKAMAQQIEKAMESKESLMKVLDEQGDVASQLRQAWKAENTADMQNFMKQGVLVTMTSEDIVRKAKAMADNNADKIKSKHEAEEEWDTVLHAENKQAKMLISANRMRMKDLKRRLAELQKRRENEKRRHAPRKADDSSDSEDEKK